MSSSRVERWVREVLPHYVIMIALMLLVITLAQSVWGDLGLWVTIAIAIAVAFAYQLAVRQLDIAPESWQ